MSPHICSSPYFNIYQCCLRILYQCDSRQTNLLNSYMGALVYYIQLISLKVAGSPDYRMLEPLLKVQLNVQGHQLLTATSDSQPAMLAGLYLSHLLNST